MIDTITTIETRCEAPETDTCYEGAHLSAEYDSDCDCTEITGSTYQCKDALKGLDGARWTGSAWIVDGNQVAAVRNADAHWAGGRTTLARRIAHALRNVPTNDCYFISLGQAGCAVAEVTAADTCAAIETVAAIIDDAEPTVRISLRPIVEAAAAAAAHAVRSARARKAWETRRRNAARQAEALAATCEPLVTTADALPASVAYSVVPGSECCHGRTAHGVDGRVVTDYPIRPCTPLAAAVCCDTGRLPAYRPRADYRWSTASEMEAVDEWYRTAACEFPDFRRLPDGSLRYNEKCIGPREGRAERARERRNARARARRAARKAALAA